MHRGKNLVGDRHGEFRGCPTLQRYGFFFTFRDPLESCDHLATLRLCCARDEDEVLFFELEPPTVIGEREPVVDMLSHVCRDGPFRLQLLAHTWGIQYQKGTRVIGEFDVDPSSCCERREDTVEARLDHAMQEFHKDDAYQQIDVTDTEACSERWLGELPLKPDQTKKELYKHVRHSHILTQKAEHGYSLAIGYPCPATRDVCKEIFRSRKHSRTRAQIHAIVDGLYAAADNHRFGDPRTLFNERISQFEGVE